MSNIEQVIVDVENINNKKQILHIFKNKKITRIDWGSNGKIEAVKLNFIGDHFTVDAYELGHDSYFYNVQGNLRFKNPFKNN